MRSRSSAPTWRSTTKATMSSNPANTKAMAAASRTLMGIRPSTSKFRARQAITGAADGADEDETVGVVDLVL